MKTEICNKTEALVEAAVSIIASQLAGKPESVLALACGETMRPVWAALAACCAAGELSLQKARILCVTEFCGAEEAKTCRHALTQGLITKTDADPVNCFFPDPDAPAAYDALIESLGGIDLAVLGIGENCHIGYNEPGTLFDTHTHVQKLTDRTKRQLLKRAFTENDMPERAVTMGIKDLTHARNILVLAAGEDKAAAVFQMLYAKNTSYIPAAYLQIPPEVTVLLDEAAASKI